MSSFSDFCRGKERLNLAELKAYRLFQNPLLQLRPFMLHRRLIIGQVDTPVNLRPTDALKSEKSETHKKTPILATENERYLLRCFLVKQIQDAEELRPLI